MKSIVVGYADAAGRTDPKLICGPDTSDAVQAKTIHAAKRNQQFPKGITRLECAFFDESQSVIAIRVSPEPKTK